MAPRSRDELRQEALRRVQAGAASSSASSSASGALHELLVHQAELEMQNQELREAQTELEVSRARYADLYDFAPVPYLTFDARGCITAINLNAAAMLGFDQAEAMGKPFASLVILAESAAFFAHIKACLSRRERVTSELNLTRRRDGTSFVVRAISSPTFEPTSDLATGAAAPLLVSTALIDVTEQMVAGRMQTDALEREQAARLALEHANRLKDDFLAVTSHELRTPLSAILGWAHLIAKTAGLAPQVRRGAEVILRNANAQARLIEDVLDIARLARGDLRLDLSDVSLSAVTREAIESVQSAADAKQISLAVDASDESNVWGDPERLKQVLWNLLANAVKFSPSGATVKVRVETRGDAVTLRVTDTGCGILPEHLGWIFDRFRQVDSGTMRPHGGLGLGLTIVKRLVLAHGGDVVAESEGLGKGSSFVITLPRLLPERASLLEVARSGSSRPPPPSKPLDSVRLLVIDDDDDAREMIAEVLETAGAVVARAPSAEAGFALAETVSPRCIVSDLGMPGEDGFSFVRRVRAANGPLALVPIVAVTAYARREDAEAAVVAGFDAHLAKPFHPDALVNLVTELLVAASRVS